MFEKYLYKKKLKALFDEVEVPKIEKYEREIGSKERKTHFSKLKFATAVIVVVIVSAILIYGIPIIKNNPTTGENEIRFENGMLAVNVYAAEQNEVIEMQLNEQITIHGNYTPMLSSAEGIGIHFEFLYENGTIELYTNNGEFVIWDVDYKNLINDFDGGRIITLGNECTIQSKGNVFWAPNRFSNQQSVINVKITQNNHITGAAVIKMVSIDESTVGAELVKLVSFPLNDGEYQNVTQEYIEEFFNI